MDATGPCCQMVQSMTRIPSSGIAMLYLLAVVSPHSMLPQGAVVQEQQAA